MAGTPSKVTETLLPERCPPITVASDPGTTGVAPNVAALTTLETVGDVTVGGGGGGGGGGAAATVRVIGMVWLPALPALMVIVAW